MQGLRQKQLRWGAAWSIQKRFNQRFCLETMLTEKSSQGYCLQDVAILTQGKSCRRLQPSYQLDLQQLETAYFIWSSSICSRCISHRNYVALTAFIKSRRVNSRTFSQAVPKHCQWKTDVRIRASSRRQNGSDAGPESFELRAFLQGLRQKQLRWGAAWSIQKRFNQRFCLETMLTQKSSQGYCLQDVAILTQGKSCRRLQPSYQLDSQQLERAYLVVFNLFELHFPSKLRGSYSFHQIQASQF